MPRNDDGTSWGSDTARLAFREIRTDAIRALRARDERLSQGQLNAANRYSPVTEIKKDNDQGSVFVPDPVLVSIRHTGEDLSILSRSRWATFCSKPQDEKPYVKRIRDRDRNDRLARMEAAGQPIEDSLVAATSGPALAPLLPKKPESQKKKPALIG